MKNRHSPVAAMLMAFAISGTAHANIGTSFVDNLSGEDAALWNRSNGASTSPAGVAWRADHMRFTGDSLAMFLNTIPCASTPEACEGRGAGAGRYVTEDSYGYGTYTAVMKGAAGNGVVTEFTTANGLLGVRIMGAATYQVQFGYFGADGMNWAFQSLNLGFDASADLHTYSFSWGAGQMSGRVDGMDVWSSAVGVIPESLAAGTISTSVWATDAISMNRYGVYDGSSKVSTFDNVSYTASLAPVTPVDEPGGAAMLAVGMGALALLQRRRSTPKG